MSPGEIDTYEGILQSVQERSIRDLINVAYNLDRFEFLPEEVYFLLYPKRRGSIRPWAPLQRSWTFRGGSSSGRSQIQKRPDLLKQNSAFGEREGRAAYYTPFWNDGITPRRKSVSLVSYGIRHDDEWREHPITISISVVMDKIPGWNSDYISDTYAEERLTLYSSSITREKGYFLFR